MDKMFLCEEARDSSKCKLSVMGPHAGESSEEIFKRKIENIERVSITFWLLNSTSIIPHNIQEYCKNNTIYVIFITPAAIKGAKPARIANCAKEYSSDKINWIALPYEKCLGKVTGNITTNTKALVIDSIQMCDENNHKIDLWEYAEDSDDLNAIRFRLGNSTIFGKKENTSSCDNKM